MNTNFVSNIIKKHSHQDVKQKIQVLLNHIDLISISELNFEYFPATNTVSTNLLHTKYSPFSVSLPGAELLSVQQGALNIDEAYLKIRLDEAILEADNNKPGYILENIQALTQSGLDKKDIEKILKPDLTEHPILAIPYKQSFEAYVDPQTQKLHHLTPYVLYNTRTGLAIEAFLAEKHTSNEPKKPALLENTGGLFHSPEGARRQILLMKESGVPDELLPEAIKGNQMFFESNMVNSSSKKERLAYNKVMFYDNCNGLYLRSSCLSLRTTKSIALQSLRLALSDNTLTIDALQKAAPQAEQAADSLTSDCLEQIKAQNKELEIAM